MRIDRTGASGPLIRAIGPGGFTVDDGLYPALLLTPAFARLWSPPPFDRLDEGALAAILDPAPEFILLGTGATLVRPPRSLVATLEARGIGIEPMDSRAAARAWGVIRAEDRQVTAALYPIA